jgi:3-carboxy-cis,cis-muconate cycloisomerase
VLRDELSAQVDRLGTLVSRHRRTLLAGRTLTQHAVPLTFGLKAAHWLTALLDAADDLARLRTPAQFGGAAGTLAATTHLARAAGATGTSDPAARAFAVAEQAAGMLGLDPGLPWHTTRAPVTRLGDGLVGCTDAWGRIAADVLTLSRPEIGELAEGTGGGSSTMPHKANPVLSVLLRRTALAAPGLGAQLHLAAADGRDERPDGAWHLEWPALRDLARHTVTAARQTTALLDGLVVHADRMRTTATAAAADLLAERDSLAHRVNREPTSNPAAAGTGDLAGYLGATDLIIDRVLARTRRPVQPEEHR